MCIGCYEDYGYPKALSPFVIELGKHIRQYDAIACGLSYGALHIVVEDWNLDDENIDFCLAQPDCDEVNRGVGLALKSLTEDERATVMALADGFIDDAGNELFKH